MKKKTKIRIRQVILDSGYRWIETIMLIDDKEAERLNDWTVGYFHCKECNAFQGFAGKLPPIDGNGVSPKMHNERNAFWREHSHGDGRIILFEKDID